VINFGGNTPLAGTLTDGAGNSYYAFVNRPRNVALQPSYMFEGEVVFLGCLKGAA
jgi:hypothetical protein